MIIQGTLETKDLRIAIVVARFNELVTARLAEGAKSAWERCGGVPENDLGRLGKTHFAGDRKGFEIHVQVQLAQQSSQSLVPIRDYRQWNPMRTQCFQGWNHIIKNFPGVRLGKSIV